MRENKIVNQNDMKIEKPFTVELQKQLVLKLPELYGRILVPINTGGYNLQIGDKYVEYSKFDTKGTSEVVFERNDDLPLGGVEDKTTLTAKLYFIRTGFQMTVAQADALSSISGDEVAAVYQRQINSNVRSIAEQENNMLIYGDASLGLKGLMTTPGSRAYTFTATLATATGAQILNAFIKLADEFENNALNNETFNARTLVMDRSVYAKLMENYSTVTDTGESIMSKLNNRGLFGRIIPIKDFKDLATGKPKMMVLDDIPENYESIMVANPMYELWTVARTVSLAIEEKLSEVIAYYPQAIMNVTLP